MKDALVPIIAIIVSILIPGIGWLFKEVIALGKQQVKFATTLQFFLVSTGKDAARELAMLTNPTPPAMAVLLRKFEKQQLTERERQELVRWLKSVVDSKETNVAERINASRLLRTIQTMEMWFEMGGASSLRLN